MDQKRAEEIVRRVSDVIQPVIDEQGLELVDVVYTPEHGRWVLRVFIDKPGGVTLGDCTTVSREIGTILDVEDIIPHSYSLEVSSPGLDRPLTKERDFLRYRGQKVRIRTREPVEGRRNFRATIDGVEDGAVIVTDASGKTWRIELLNIDRARLEVVV